MKKRRQQKTTGEKPEAANQLIRERATKPPRIRATDFFPAAGRTVLSAWTLLLVLFTVGAASASAASRSLKSRLVKASFTQRTDAQGYRWDFRPDGTVSDGTNDCFDGGMRLRVNGSNFNCSNPMQTPDGSEHVLMGQAGNLKITRRIKLDAKQSFARYVESVKNTSGKKVSVSLGVHNNLGTNAQQVVTDTGQQNPATLGKKACGLVGLQRIGASRPSAVFYLAGAKSKLKPSVYHRGDDLNFTYSFTVRPGKTVSILYAVAQRRFSSALNDKSLKALFKPFKSRKWIKDLPKGVLGTIENKRRGYASFLVPGFVLDLRDIQRSELTSDLLVLGQETQLHGETSCPAISVETEYGSMKVPFERVAAFTGGGSLSLQTRLFLRDGQVFTGKAQAQRLLFTMPSGISLDLGLEGVDCLVTRPSKEDFKPSEKVTALIETYNGNRLAVLGDQKEGANSNPTLHLATVWGHSKIPLEETMLIQPLPENEPGHLVLLKDGSKFSAFLTGEEMVLNTLSFGKQTFAPSEIKSIRAASILGGNEEEEEKEILEPYVILAGENRFVGRIELSELHLVTSGEIISVPPNQIKEFRNISMKTGEVSAGGSLFSALIWGGGSITGYLEETFVPVRFGSGVLHVPSRDIAMARVPTPYVPEQVQKKIAGLIRNLGHSDWEKRQEASKKLADYGHMARAQLKEARDHASDPEVVRRTRILLEELEL